VSHDHYSRALSDAVTTLGREAIKNGGALRLDTRCDGQPVAISVKLVRPPVVRRREADLIRPEGLEPHPQETWDSGYVRQLLAGRDIGAVYRHLLREYRYSQSELGTLTGQSQAEVSAIAGGHREILSLELLERVVAGLGIQPCLVGLRCPDCKHQPLSDQQVETNPAETEPVQDGLTEAEEGDRPGGPPAGFGMIFLAPQAG
jgi:hypothetical protein